MVVVVVLLTEKLEGGCGWSEWDKVRRVTPDGTLGRNLKIEGGRSQGSGRRRPFETGVTRGQSSDT